MKYFLSVLGMVMVVEGLPYFAFPDQIKSMLTKISESPSRMLRIMGFILIAFGLGVIYISQRTGLF